MQKVWFITGSSRGLGRALAEAVLARGDRLVATARDPKAVADLVESAPDRAIAVPLDVTDPTQAAAAVDAAKQAFGRIDVLVNNAGYADNGSFEEMPADAFAAQIDTNMWGVINMTRAVLPVLHEQHAGHIIQISTIGGRRGFPGLSGYHTAKFAVEGFSETLAAEIAPLGLKLTIIEPGGFRTDWAGSSMRHFQWGPDYEPSVGMMAKLARGHEPVGDPAKAAQAIIEVADADEPPLRLPLGNDAVDLIRAGDHAKLAEIDRWEELSRSTDHDDAVPYDLNAIA